ncbi:transposon Tf2-9 polyprotein [Trichonephila clavipes]|nr:transposon Tf2-9 polyprotein [Trichonephila clavipes]
MDLYPHIKLVNKKAFSIRFQKVINPLIVTIVIFRTITIYKKCYKHLFTVIDSFSKFVWIYPVKSTSTKDALDKLILQQTIFGNPSKIITDKEDLQIKHLLEDELSEQFINKRETLRNEAKENILRLQAENKKQYNKHRKPSYNYKPGDTVAIQRTQFGTGLKLRPKYFGPYEVTKVNKHDRYEVQKIGQHEGPNVTSTSADKMKKWFHLFPSAEDGVVIRCPCGYQLLADHFRSHDRTEVTRGGQRDGETVLFPPP